MARVEVMGWGFGEGVLSIELGGVGIGYNFHNPYIQPGLV